MNAASVAQQVEAQLHEERKRRRELPRTPEERATARVNVEQLVSWYLKPAPRALEQGAQTDG